MSEQDITDVIRSRILAGREDDMRLLDRAAIVTGGGRGIGRAIALGFAWEGANVAIADIDLAAAERTAEEIRALGRMAVAIQVDVVQRVQVEAMVERAAAEFDRVDILVSNAGVSPRHHFLELPEEEWDRVLGINLKGVFLCGQAAARQMARGGGGAIINIASQRAESADYNMAAYCTSKGGVKTLTKAMALDLAEHGIRVNAIGPGPTLTDLNRHRFEDPDSPERKRALGRVPMGRLGSPADHVGAAIFLASDEARWVTGHCLFVDGGWMAG